MTELRPRRIAEASQAQAALESKQSHRKVLALALLLIAFVAVIAKDWDFWFGADQSADADLAQPAAAAAAPVKPAPQATSPARPAPAMKKQASTAAAAQPKPADSGVVATNRTSVPPLNVEVVAGDSHRMVSPGSTATKVELTRPASPANSRSAELTANLAAPTKAAEVERVSSARPALGSFDGTYPLLAQQTRVQGSVVLQALIGADGLIQNLRILSGPRILSTAAQQAVREWRFKPYIENGQPVETKATITVNFTINVADGTTTTAVNAPPLHVIQLGE